MRISDWSSDVCSSDLLRRCSLVDQIADAVSRLRDAEDAAGSPADRAERGADGQVPCGRRPCNLVQPLAHRRKCGVGIDPELRAEERRGGKEGVSKCIYWWSADH